MNVNKFVKPSENVEMWKWNVRSIISVLGYLTRNPFPHCTYLFTKIFYMETMQIQDSRMFSLVRLYDLHSQYFYNVLDGVSDQDAHSRMQTKATHIAWIAGSLVYESYLLAHLLNS